MSESLITKSYLNRMPCVHRERRSLENNDVFLFWREWDGRATAEFDIPDGFFEEIFPVFEPFEHVRVEVGTTSSSASSGSIPVASFVAQRLRPEARPEQREKVHEWTEELKSTVQTDHDGRITDEAAASLAERRDYLEKYLQRTASHLRQPMHRLRGVLQVSFHDAAQALERRVGGADSSTAKPADSGEIAFMGPFARLKMEYGILWRAIVSGAPTNELTTSVGSVSRLPYLPGLKPDQVEQQRDGIVYYLKKRDQILDGVPMIELERLIYEQLLLYSIADEVPPDLGEAVDQAVEQRPREKTLRRRKRLVVDILMQKDENGNLTPRDDWKDEKPAALFREIEKRDRDLISDTNGNSVRRYFSRVLSEGDFPGGDAMDRWFELARKWAAHIYPELSDTGT